MKFIKCIMLILLCLGIIGMRGADLSKILLIINYNHAHYESMPLLKELYGKYFNTIVFYGPEAHPNLHCIKHFRGFFSYFCIAHAMKKYPNFDGYFFLMDDCILNAKLLNSLDSSKLWLAEVPHIENRGTGIDVRLGEKAHTWSWWSTKWGCGPATRSFNELPGKYKEMLATNWQPYHVAAAFSDVAYIPVRFKEKFIELTNLFIKHKTFLEIALPTIVSCLDLKSNWVWLTGQHTLGPDPLKLFNFDAYFNHPVKLSFKRNRDFIEERMLKVVVDPNVKKAVEMSKNVA